MADDDMDEWWDMMNEKEEIQLSDYVKRGETLEKVPLAMVEKRFRDVVYDEDFDREIVVAYRYEDNNGNRLYQVFVLVDISKMNPKILKRYRTTDCNGDKCRKDSNHGDTHCQENWCTACFGEPTAANRSPFTLRGKDIEHAVLALEDDYHSY